jgi:hypothetical protein
MPWDVTASFLITDSWEAALRYEDLDEANNFTQVSGGISYYVSGHNMKWGLLYITQDADDASQAEDEIVFETTIAF